MHNLTDVKLIDLHTPSIADDPNVKAMSEALDVLLHETVGFVENVAIIKRIVRRTATESWLVDEMAHQWHVDFYDPTLPFETRLELVANWIELHLLKGTPAVVEKIVTIVFADAEVEEWFEYDGVPYAFKVGTEITDVTGDEMKKLVDAIFSVKNTRSWLEGINVLWRARAKKWFVGMGVAQRTEVRTAMKPPTFVEFKGTGYFGSVLKLRPVALNFMEV